LWTRPGNLPKQIRGGIVKRILAFIGITEVEVILAGGTAAVTFGSITVEELAAQFRPAVLAAAR